MNAKDLIGCAAYAFFIGSLLRFVAFIYFIVFSIARSIGFEQVESSESANTLQWFVMALFVRYEVLWFVGATFLSVAVAYGLNRFIRFNSVIAIVVLLAGCIVFTQYALELLFAPALIGSLK